MDVETYLNLKQKILDSEYWEDIAWSESIEPCDNIADFICEYIFVVCNSGMKAKIARTIFGKIMTAIKNNIPIWNVFKNFAKVNAINHVLGLKSHYFREYLRSENTLEFCATLPYMGETIKYHLAKNLGYDCIKPDRHLERIAKSYNTDPFSMCEKLAKETGDRLATVDTVIWRAAAIGLI